MTRLAFDRACSEGRQVALDLPGPDLRVVRAPLVAFDAEEFVGDRSQAVADDGVVLEVVEGLTQALGEDVEAAFGPRGRALLVEVPEVRLARVEPVRDAVEARGEVRGEGEVGVARG